MSVGDCVQKHKQMEMNTWNDQVEDDCDGYWPDQDWYLGTYLVTGRLFVCNKTGRSLQAE